MTLNDALNAVIGKPVSRVQYDSTSTRDGIFMIDVSDPSDGHLLRLTVVWRHWKIERIEVSDARAR